LGRGRAMECAAQIRVDLTGLGDMLFLAVQRL
jgi:hypothetical protein